MSSYVKINTTPNSQLKRSKREQYKLWPGEGIFVRLRQSPKTICQTYEGQKFSKFVGTLYSNP